VQGIIVKSDTL